MDANLLDTGKHVIKSGKLIKRSNMLKRVQNREFRLTKEGEIYYHKTKRIKDFCKLNAESAVEFIGPKKGKKNNVIKFKIGSDNKFMEKQLETCSEKDARDWIESITNLISSFTATLSNKGIDEEQISEKFTVDFLTRKGNIPQENFAAEFLTNKEVNLRKSLH